MNLEQMRGKCMVEAQEFCQMLMDVDKERIEYLEKEIAKLKKEKEMSNADWGVAPVVGVPLTATHSPVHKAPPKKLAWSWSRLECFRQCPLKFQHQNILKTIKFTGNAATERGKKVHKQLEDNVTKNTPLPEELSHMLPIINGFKAIPGAELIAERSMAFDQQMNTVTFFDKSVWLRCIIDLTILLREQKTAILVDWKTGKVKPYADQLALCAMVIFHLYPEIENITSMYLFVDHKQKTEAVYSRSDYDHLMMKFSDESELIQLTNESGDWRPTANQFCSWCDISPEYCPHKKYK